MASRPTGGTNSEWQQAKETRLQCSARGFSKDHREEGEEPDADQHRGELYDVIPEQPILVLHLLAHPASPFNAGRAQNLMAKRLPFLAAIT